MAWQTHVRPQIVPRMWFELLVSMMYVQLYAQMQPQLLYKEKRPLLDHAEFHSRNQASPTEV